MRPRAFSLLCIALAIFLIGATDAQTARRLEGTWQGALADKPSRGSRELRRGEPPQSPTIVAIQAASDGTYSGKWFSTPQKGLGDIENVTVDGDTVRFGGNRFTTILDKDAPNKPRITTGDVLAAWWSMERQGDQAQVQLPLGDRTVSLLLSRRTGSWKIAGIRPLSALIEIGPKG